MARPRKTGLEYFPFDVDFFDDDKVVRVGGEYGIKGEMVAIRLLCAIYRNGYFALWDELLRYKILRQLPSVSPDLLDQIINRLVKWGFFDQSLFDSVKVLTSPGIQRRYFEITKRCERDADLPYLLINVAKTRVNAAKTRVNAAKTPQIKQNKIKINTTSPLPPPGDGRSSGSSGSGGDLNFQLKMDEKWISTVAETLHLPPAKVVAEIDRFFRDCQCRGLMPATADQARNRCYSFMRAAIPKGSGSRTTGALRAPLSDAQQFDANERRRQQRQLREAQAPPPISARALKEQLGLPPDASIASTIIPDPSEASAPP